MPATFDGNMNKITDKKEKKVLKMKQKAVLALAEALGEDTTTFAHHEAGSTDEYPDGLAHVIWSSLKDSYDIRDSVTAAEIGSQMQVLTFTKSDDPKEYADQLFALQQRAKRTTAPIPDGEAVSYMTNALPLNALPLYYATPIAQHAREQEQLGKTVTVLSLGLYLQPIYRTSDQKKKHDDKRRKNTDSTKKKTGGNVALGSVNHNVKCFNCNEMGHMSRNCPKRRGPGRQGRGRGRFGGRGEGALADEARALWRTRRS
jgi:hypothetical protein